MLALTPLPLLALTEASPVTLTPALPPERPLPLGLLLLPIFSVVPAYQKLSSS